MIIRQIDATDLNDAWFQLIETCYAYGREYVVGIGSYAGSQKRRELDYVTIHIKYPGTRPLLPTIPLGQDHLNPVPEGMDYIERYLPYLLTNERQEYEAYTYGSRLFGLVASARSQVDVVVEKLAKSFDTNQASLSISQPSDICLDDPPCLRHIDCRIFSDGDDKHKLHFYVYFRSWDAYCGFPANMAALVYLQEHIADMITAGRDDGVIVEAGEIVASSKGAHIYDMYWDLARQRLG